MTRLILLGPQRHQPTVAAALDSLQAPGAVAVITAGWQEREEEVDELREHVDRPVLNLQLHRRAEEIFQRSPEVFQALRRRQNQLRALQRLYRLRLDAHLGVARRLLRLPIPATGEDLLETERRAAIDAVRRLDQHHRQQLRRIHTEFEAEWQPRVEEAVEEHRQQVRELLEQADSLAIAGGHVAVLLNRLRLFRIDELIGPRPVVAWSAGAMALAERVVLFHDRPPQGAGNAELLELGLGLYKGVLPLPHARARLRLDDEVRVSLFARRFSPDRCMALDAGGRLERRGRRWVADGDCQRLTASGEIGGIEAA